MKRLLLTVLIAAAAVSLPALGPGRPTGPESTGATGKPGCLKIWHKKKATKWVKRNGKRRKITYTKKWWTCDPYESPGPPRLGVKATEFKFSLSRPEVKAGNLILEFNNRGEDTHNLRIADLKTNRPLGVVADTRSRRTRTETFALKPGLYKLTCTLFNHAKRGMKARLRVLP